MSIDRKKIGDHTLKDCYSGNKELVLKVFERIFVEESRGVQKEKA